MVKSLVIGDPHFKVSNVTETESMRISIMSILDETKVDFIVVLGDILDRHETIHVSPLKRSVTFLTELSKYAPTYVLIGNHDLKNNRQFLSDEHGLIALKYSTNDNLIIVDTTINAIIAGLQFTFVPYVPPGRFLEALDYSEPNIWQQSICIFAHQEFKDAQMGAIISIEGDEWHPQYPKVISGHIHDYQEIGTNIVYIGTPFQHTFGDRQDKSIAYCTFENSTVNIKRLELNIRKKQIVHLSVADVDSYQPASNYDLKIVINGVSGEIKSVMKHPNVDTWKKSGHKVVFKDIPLSGLVELPTTAAAPKKFSEVLYESVLDDPRLFHAYQQIFTTEPKIHTITTKLRLMTL